MVLGAYFGIILTGWFIAFALRVCELVFDAIFYALGPMGLLAAAWIFLARFQFVPLRLVRLVHLSLLLLRYTYHISAPLPTPAIPLFCSRSIPKTWVYAQSSNFGSRLSFRQRVK
jgi:hypothetical protein